MAVMREPRQYDELRGKIGEIRGELDRVRNLPFLANDDLYSAWNRQVAGLIRSVDEFNQAPLMRSAETYETLNGSLRQTGRNIREFREDPRKFLRIKVF
jgi:hypothetical protein